MPTPGEHKTVQARILAYAQEIGWDRAPEVTFVGNDSVECPPIFFGQLIQEQVQVFRIGVFTR